MNERGEKDIAGTGRRESRRRVRTVLLLPFFPSFAAYVPTAGTSWSVILLLGFGTVVVVLVFVLFLADERYRRPSKPERGVGFVEARLAAGDQLSSLSPKVVLLAEKERLVDDSLENGILGRETRRTVEELRREVSATRFWRRFITASTLIEDDPARAYEELRLRAPVAVVVLEKLARAEEVIGDTKGGNGGRA